jgi:hypothetical protein
LARASTTFVAPAKTWMAGPSPAMTLIEVQRYDNGDFSQSSPLPLSIASTIFGGDIGNS